VTEAILAVVDGDLDRAAAAAEAAGPFAVRSGDRFTTSRIAYVLGMVDDLRGDAEGAYRHIEESLRLVDELGLPQAVTAQARLLVPLAERAGEVELAAQWRAFVNERGEGWTHFDEAVVAAARNREALAARAAGDVARAFDAHAFALDSYTSAGISAGIAFTHSCLGFLAGDIGDVDAAARHHAAALAKAVNVDDPAVLALSLEGRATTAAEPLVVASLLGAAERLWGESEPATEATHRADVAAMAAAARAVLDDDAFTASWAAGAKLDRQAVIALARRTR
jgi:hypothetical protein